MPTLVQKFINAITTLKNLSRIPDRLDEIRQSIDEQGEAIRATNERDKHQDNEQPVPITVKLESEQEGNRTTEGNRQYRVQNSIRKATWWTFVAASAYAGIAAYQTSLYKQQLDITRNGISAQLAIQNFSLEIIPGSSFSVNIKYTIKNVGGSIANEINDMSASNGGGTFPKDTKPNGPSLAPGETREVTSMTGDGPKEFVLNGTREFSVGVAVAYRDIFGNPHVTSDCRVFNRSTTTFTSCGSGHQHE